MDKVLLAAYRASAYHVRLRQGGVATIRIDQVLPASLQALAGESPWSFVTAWNPRSRSLPREINRQSQRVLLNELQARADVLTIHAGTGVGTDGWREPSLFVVGPDQTAMATMARKHEQHAFLHGNRLRPAHLCWVDG